MSTIKYLAIYLHNKAHSAWSSLCNQVPGQLKALLFTELSVSHMLVVILSLFPQNVEGDERPLASTHIAAMLFSIKCKKKTLLRHQHATNLNTEQL